MRVAEGGVDLFWVQPDPGREVAVDALGLASQADRIADELLPQMSVLTRRARYLSFLCWARKKSSSLGEMAAHEGRLAVAAAQMLERKPDHKVRCPAIVGRQRTLDARQNGKVSRAERLYKRRAFPDYRALMRRLRLIGGGAFGALEEDGERLARAYSSHWSPSQCLCEIGATERTIIKQLLGFDGRAVTSEAGDKRRQTLDTVRRYLAPSDESGVVYPGEVLAHFRDRPTRNGDGSPGALHRAYVWELASVALDLTFAMLAGRLADDADAMGVAGELAKARRSRAHSPGIESVLSVDEDAARNVVGLAAEACRRRRDDMPFDLSAWWLLERLVVDHDAKGFVRGVVDRHQATKAGDAWIRLATNGRRLERLASSAKDLPSQAEVRSYRLRALADMARDLGLL